MQDSGGAQALTKRRRLRWTTSKTGYLLENAGSMALEDIASSLGCTPESVKQQAKRIRRTGQHVSLRRKPVGLRICPSCGKRRSTFSESGGCRVCELDERLATIKSRQAALLSHLPPSDRATYARTEAQLASDPLPKPKPARTIGMTAAEKMEAAEARDRAIEAWEIGCLNRKIKAAQKRKERMEEKCRTQSYDTLPDQKHRGEIK